MRFLRDFLPGTNFLLPGTLNYSAPLLPGLLVGLFSCLHRGILKTLVAHPSVFLLPVFTHFTFVSNSKLCCKGEIEEERFISFSPKATAVNVGVTVTGILAFIFTMPLFSSAADYTVLLDRLCGTDFYLGLGLPCSLLGLILTLVTTFSNQYSCCRTCCCFCCSEPFEFGALVTSSPYIPYIIGPDDQLVREENADKGEDKGEKAESLEMEKSKDGGDLVSSSSDLLLAKTEADKVIMREEEEKVEEQLELSVHIA